VRTTLKLKIIAALSIVVALGFASAAIYERYRVRVLMSHENISNPIEAQKLRNIQVSLDAPVLFQRENLDNRNYLGGRKGKVIINPDGHGSVPGAQVGPLGFALYPPGKAPVFISKYSRSDGLEDAQVADVNGDGAPDIVAGGIGAATYALINPQGSDCVDVYRCGWPAILLDTKRIAHDLLVADMDQDGVLDVITEAGIYFNRANGKTWQFIGRGPISRDGEGTSIGILAKDKFPDIVAPFDNGTKLARFVNPLHTHSGPTSRWQAHVIDAHPLFTGNMTTAVSDINGDGRNDILLAPMYGGGGLVWYEAPLAFDGIWPRHMIDPTINFVHQGSLQMSDFDGDGHLDIAFAEQDQSPTKRIGIFYNIGGKAASFRLQVLSTEGGHNIKVGRILNDRFASILSARHGFFDDANPLLVFRNGKQ
jgi:hypothetical protein